VLNSNTRLVLGREDGALHSFRRAKELGAQTIYDLPTAHYTTVRRILEREEAEFPDVCTRPGVQDALTPAQLEHKDAELSCADHVIVGSAFVKQSLTEAGFPEARVTVLPSACQADWLPSTSIRINPHGCVVLHVGYLSLRKGTHRLLRVWKRLKAYRTHRLRLIGDMDLSPRFLRDFQGCFEHVPHLPREQLRAHYALADIFALPAAAEGFAGVILEALSFGVPIIASRSSGAEGFLEQGKEALLHDFANEDQLCADLDWMVSHPVERAEMARQAQAKAMSWTWKDYRRRFVEIVNDIERGA
jgi:glycosyltransferase involved in cell wall biosynthesis